MIILRGRCDRKRDFLSVSLSSQEPPQNNFWEVGGDTEKSEISIMIITGGLQNALLNQGSS